MPGIELLAPAKDLACGIAAIDAGADAVYLGAPRFGARENAGNSLDDIAALVNHAHRYWARVYVTLNTLLYDEELPQAVALAHAVYDLGVDGLIIQDAGLLECDLPPLPLIASTQMHNAAPERVAFLEGVGFQRAILARELSLEEIHAIRARTHLELECFVHGALCVCYSGQCYLSYALGGRSGNRGQCAQPCRKAYDLHDAHGALLKEQVHALSLRDLNLSAHLRELLDAGVTSLKIEGRLKDRAYVVNVVHHYRRALDVVLAEMGLARSSSGTSSADFTPDVHKTFNRGYTTHFLHGRREPVGAPETPKMIGELLGPVTALARNAVTVATTETLHPGDGVSFFTPDRVLSGATVNAVAGNVLTLGNCAGLGVGTVLYRNHDHDFLTRLEKSRLTRRIGVVFTVREAPDGLTVLARDEDGVTADFTLAGDKTPADKPDAARATLCANLQKCGGTPFDCREVIVELSAPLFVPVSSVNALRRGALEALTVAREAERPRPRGGTVRNDALYPVRTLTYEGNVLNARAAAFYRRHGVTEIATAAETGRDLRGCRVMTTRHCLLHQFGACVDGRRTRPVATPLTLTDAEGQVLELRFACRACRMEVWLPTTKTGE